MTSGLFVETRAQAGGLAYLPAGYFFAVEGTAYPGAPAPPSFILNDGTGYWCGFSSGMAGGMANTVDGLFRSSMIGYSAATVPMGPSVQQGLVYLASAIEMVAEAWKARYGSYDALNELGAPLVMVLTGYSQGAMVTAVYWTQYVLNPNGPHNYLANHIYRIYQFGDPYRCPGVAHGNALAGLPESIKADGVETGGIAGKLVLTPDQANLRAPDGGFIYCSCANHGDIYACAPIGLTPQKSIASAGRVGNLIFTEIQNPSFINTIKIAESLLVPIGMVEEIINGMVFAAQGTNAPHWQYFPQMVACIGDCLALGQSIPHETGY